MLVPNNQQKKKKTGLVIGTTSLLAIALAGGVVYYTAVIDQPTEETLTQSSQQQKQQIEEPVQSVTPTEPIVEAPPLEKVDATKYDETKELPTEPTYINDILIANKQYPLPSTYAPDTDPTAQAALDTMVAAAAKENIQLVGFSGYRSYDYQTTLYNNYVARDGQEEADRYSARPGYSEHQTGLAFDIGEVGKEDLWLTAAFGETPAGQWLVQHAPTYGFILRYPKGKEHLTGFMYESWHFRYVGAEHALKITEQNMTLEEYLGVYEGKEVIVPQVAEEVTQEDVSTVEQTEVAATEETQVGAKSEQNNP